MGGVQVSRVAISLTTVAFAICLGRVVEGDGSDRMLWAGLALSFLLDLLDRNHITGVRR